MNRPLGLAALAAAALLTATGALALGPGYVLAVQDKEQAWIYKADEVTVTDDGLRKAQLYEIWVQGQPMGGRIARVVDTVTLFDCKTLQIKPVTVEFRDEALDFIGRGKVEDDQPWIDTTPDSRYGKAAQAVCHPETIPAAARLSADSPKAAVGALIAGFK